MAGAGEIQYLVLPDLGNPYLLARVRWPDIFQAISPVRPDWQQDPGLFDLPYSSSSRPVTFDRAAAIAAEWGGHLPADDDTEMPRWALMRRMPADWSNLSRAERRAWSIEDVKPATPGPAGDARAEQEDAVPAGAARRRWRRRGKAAPPASEPVAVPSANGATNGNGNGNGHTVWAGAEVIDLSDAVIDLTEASDDVAVTAEDA
jgi:hypothetical protein